MDTGKHELRPRYSDATPEQLKLICNGVGPSWAPPPVRKTMTVLSGWFFDEASWNHHDFGYYIGCRERHRLYCDNRFLKAMFRDCLRQPVHKFGLAMVLSGSFYLAVRCFGWASFYYGQDYQSL